MIIPQIERPFVTGTVYRRVTPTVRLEAGTYNISMVLGVSGAVSTATCRLRQVSNGSTLLTFTSALDPARVASQSVTLASQTDVDFTMANSAEATGTASVEDIRISVAPLQLWANNISVRLGGPVAIDATAIELASGAGDQIGLSPTGGQFFLVSLVSGTNLEIVRCTARTNDTITVTRAQEGTSARAWQVSGTNVIIAATATTLSTLQAGL